MAALDRFQYVTGWSSGYGLRDSIAFFRRERERQPAGMLVVTLGPSTTAGAVHLLLARDPGVDCTTSIPRPMTGRPPLRASAGRSVSVVVSLDQGVRLPAGWSREVTPFASFEPDGAPADALYRAGVATSCVP